MALLCLVLWNRSAKAQILTAGPHSATISSNNTAIGTAAWSTMSDVTLSDNNHAICSQLLGILSSVTTNYLVVSGLGFSIPQGSTILGITVSIERSAGGLGLGCVIKDADVRIVKDGTPTGTDKASSANWGGIDATATYGGANDLWGTAWMPSDINSAGFGVAIAATMESGLVSLLLSAKVDYISVTVHYMVPTTLPLRPRETTAQTQVPVRPIGFYPNPASSNSSIYITGRRKTATITIKDLEGRVVKRVQIDPGIHLPQVALTGMTPGLYLLEIDHEVFRLNVAR